MTTNSIPFTFSISPPPSPRHQPKSSMPIFYYGLVIVGTASIILALYNFMILRWCTNRHRRMSSQQTSEIPISNTHISEASNTQFLVKSFKYKKDENVSQDQGLEYVHECPVCISTFQEGEDVRKLPRCKHTFHMSCIDMWLHSHPDCPVCRAPVRVLLFRLEDVGDQSENSREVLLLGSNAV